MPSTARSRNSSRRSVILSRTKKGLPKVKTSRLFAGSLAAAVFAIMAPASVNASPRSACSVVTLAEVRDIVAAPVVIFQAGSNNPTVQGTKTFSNCTYTMMGAGHVTNGRGAELMLMWGPQAALADTYKFYANRKNMLPRIKGDLLIVVYVTDTTGGRLAFDLPASNRLLDAAVKNL
jgi:hypothetical protein